MVRKTTQVKGDDQAETSVGKRSSRNKVSKKNSKVSKNTAPKSVKATSETLSPLTPRQIAFVDEYLIDLNGTQAAIRAGYSANTAASVACENLIKPNIAAAIAKRQQERLARVEIRQDDVLRVLLNMLAADANDLVEHRRHCCRYCWGKDNRFQRTQREMDDDRIRHEDEQRKLQNDPANAGMPIRPFNEQGGIGYDERKPANQDCQECFGDGVGKTIIKDTRMLPEAAKALYAGVKQTREGLEVKMQSKEAYLQLLMRHAGMLNDKVKVQGDPENPLQLLFAQISGTHITPKSGKDGE